MGDSAGWCLVLAWELVQKVRAIPQEGPFGAIPQEGVRGKLRSSRSWRVLDDSGLWS